MPNKIAVLLCLPLFTVLLADVPDKASRMKGMLWGALVADAAALGAHWYYDQEKLLAQFPDGIEGFEQPAEDHYHKTKNSGQFTMYGDALKLLLQVAAGEGGYSPEAFGKLFMNTMTPGYYDGYVDHATRESFEIYQAHLKEHPDTPFDFQQGSDDNQMAGATSLMPIVILYGESDQFYDQVAAFVRIRQNNGEAIAYCQFQAGILQALLSGLAPEDAIEQALQSAPLDRMMKEAIRARIRDAKSELANDDFIQSTFELGYSCPLQGSFPASLYSFLKLMDGSYEDAILSVVRAGGESAGRGMLVGAFLGAYHGENYIPEGWKSKLESSEKLASLIEQIVDIQ
ncbi:MAG: ADP-ribosylglycohydrolase family protein [Opitutales bacterium]